MGFITLSVIFAERWIEMKDILVNDFDILHDTYKKTLMKLDHSTVLITGANGMITTYFSEFLLYLAERYEIQLYFQVRNVNKAMKTFSSYVDKPYLHIVNFDFENKEIPDICFDYIIHAASPASTKFFVESPVDVISPNVIGTWNLLQFAKNNGVKKFLLCSSNSIYGEGGIDKVELTEEDYGIVDPLNERSSYIESKRLAEQMSIAFWKQYNVPVSIIRICHTYGPTFDLERDGRIIPRVIKQIINGEDITIYKDPNSVIQYTYIADMVAAILLVLLEGKDGEAYNAGGDEIVKMDDVIAWMINADPAIKSKLIEKKIDDNYSFAKGKGVNFVKLSNRKLTELGWKQLFSNKEGFSRVVKSYISNQNFGGVQNRHRNS